VENDDEDITSGDEEIEEEEDQNYIHIEY